MLHNEHVVSSINEPLELDKRKRIIPVSCRPSLCFWFVQSNEIIAFQSDTAAWKGDYMCSINLHLGRNCIDRTQSAEWCSAASDAGRSFEQLSGAAIRPKLILRSKQRHKWRTDYYTSLTCVRRPLLRSWVIGAAHCEATPFTWIARRNYQTYFWIQKCLKAVWGEIFPNDGIKCAHIYSKKTMWIP